MKQSNSCYGRAFEEAAVTCRVIRDSNNFTRLVTVTIVVVGLAIGIDTDHFMHCKRLEERLKHGTEEHYTAEWDNSSCDDKVHFVVTWNQEN
jgi:hypothetical protein